jgi:hypothetical protein
MAGSPPGHAPRSSNARLAAYCGVQKVIALNSWTNACELVLRWYGIGPGDEVIVPAYTYCATANIVMHVGAKPVLVDVLDDFTMDPGGGAQGDHASGPSASFRWISAAFLRTSEIMRIAEEACIHFTPNGELARGWNNPTMRSGRALVLEPMRPTPSVPIGGLPVGAQADITGFSFHAVKNLTTAEGGALAFHLPRTLRHEQLYRPLQYHEPARPEQGRARQDQARSVALRCGVPGLEVQHDRLQAAIGLVELERYDKRDPAAPQGHLRAVCGVRQR